MRNIIFTAVAAITCMALVSFAEGKKPTTTDELIGRYGFNWFNSPSRQKCKIIDEKLLSDFKIKYSCNLNEREDSSTGKPHIICSSKDKSKEYLIFKTKALCEDERLTQEANGP